MSPDKSEVDVVTAIVASPRAPGRFSVVVDGMPFATLAIDAIERLSLSIGASVAGRLDVIQQEEAALHTYDRAVSMLAAQPRSARDLAYRLVRKGEDPELVRRAVERLRGAGLVDDASFARQLARSKLLGAGYSPRRLRQELGNRGVARDVAEHAVDEVVAEEGLDEIALVMAAARKKLRTLSSVDAPTRKRRLYSFLARRGYDSDAIRQVLEQVRKELDER
jgi:regulatory protein